MLNALLTATRVKFDFKDVNGLLSAPKRDLGIDLVKTIAIISVVMLHICSAGFSLPLRSFGWTATLFYGALVRAGVPLFLMCSGALLLDEKRSLPLKKLWLHNILRIIVAMLFWGVMYKLYHLCDSGTFSFPALWHGVKEVLLFNQEFHFYYLHIILLVYALLPVLRAFVQNADRRLLRYALAIWFALGILYPTVKPFWPFSLFSGTSRWLMSMTYAALGYALLGYYLKKYSLKIRSAAALTAAGFLFTFFATFFMSRRHGENYLFFLEGMSLGPALLAGGIFSLGTAARLREGSAAARLCAYISKASFCIYLTHIFVLNTFSNWGISALSFSSALSIPLISAVILLICCVFYFVLSKVPVVKKWLI